MAGVGCRFLGGQSWSTFFFPLGRGGTTRFNQQKWVGEECVAKATSKWPQSLKMDVFFFLLPAVDAKMAKNRDFFENKGPFWVKMKNGKTEGQRKAHIIITRCSPSVVVEVALWEGLNCINGLRWLAQRRFK